MKRQIQKVGKRKWFGDDFILLQDETYVAMEAILSPYGDFILKGCEVTVNTIASGIVIISGKICRFDGGTATTFPCYFELSSVETQNRIYEDGNSKATILEHKAVLSSVVPSGSYITINSNGGKRFLEAIQDSTHRFSSDSEKSAWNGKAAGDHNHNTTYLGLNAQATDSLKLDGKSAASYSLYSDGIVALPSFAGAGIIDFSNMKNYSSDTALTGNVTWGVSNIKIGKTIYLNVIPGANSISLIQAGVVFKGDVNIVGKIKGLDSLNRSLISITALTSTILWVALVNDLQYQRITYGYGSIVPIEINTTVNDSYREVIINSNGRDCSINLNYILSGSILEGAVEVFFCKTTNYVPGVWTSFYMKNSDGSIAANSSIAVAINERLFIRVRVVLGQSTFNQIDFSLNFNNGTFGDVSYQGAIICDEIWRIMMEA